MRLYVIKLVNDAFLVCQAAHGGLDQQRKCAPSDYSSHLSNKILLAT